MKLTTFLLCLYVFLFTPTLTVLQATNYSSTYSPPVETRTVETRAAPPIEPIYKKSKKKQKLKNPLAKPSASQSFEEGFWWGVIALFYLGFCLYSISTILKILAVTTLGWIYIIPTFLVIGLTLWFIGVALEFEIGPVFMAIFAGVALTILSIIFLIAGLVLGSTVTWILALVFMLMSITFGLFPLFYDMEI